MTEAPQLPRLFLQPGHDRRIAHGYPWAFSNELHLDATVKALAPGSLVTLHRVDGKPYGVGSFNSHALIAFRLFDRDPSTAIDAEFFAVRLQRALALRTKLFPEPFYRLAHAEADGLPGLVLDRFGDAVVAQANTAAIDQLSPLWLQALEAVLSPQLIVLRNDSPAREAEGLARRVEIAKGEVTGPVALSEAGIRYFADLCAGQKTGWFFDQRASRSFVAALAAGGSLLDVFCHSGGFAVAAARAGAHSIVAIDSSEPALALARRAAEANGVADRCRFHRGDAYAELERLHAARAQFSVVACDPPPFVRSRKDLGSGLRGYRKLARLGATLVTPGGFLFIASCSHNVTAEAFATEVARGLQAAGRSGRILRAAGADADHPIHPQLPESAYLKSLVLNLD
jgi:23S rRNA (cytosine1962-C5)-methyltransferase